MNHRRCGCKQRISMKIYDCRALMCRLGKVERSMQEVCRVLAGVGGRRRRGCGDGHCERKREARGR